MIIYNEDQDGIIISDEIAELYNLELSQTVPEPKFSEILCKNLEFNILCYRILTQKPI